MPCNAKIFIAEDEGHLLKIEKIILKLAGHEVVLEARSLDKALDNVNLAKTKEVTVAVIDEHLDNGPGDGPKIAQDLKNKVPGIKIVAFSASDEPTEWGHLNLRKPQDIIGLGENITAL